MINRYLSDIPKDAIEKIVSEYKKKGGAIWPKKAECWYDGNFVGERFYENNGTLIIERPLKDGKTHGIEYSWDDDGTLFSAEPYENGMQHGTATQWDRDGNIIGTYTLEHGTGYDIWRSKDENGKIIISEIHSIKDGAPHGFEWWLNDDQKSVHTEKHWFKGTLHGIEREWEYEGDLTKGWPKYWINNVDATKSEYITASKKDSRLPVFSELDQNSRRVFPKDILKIMEKC